uniref:RING-type domain-containing protein n=1 Tax=viral metagenome TaxID=1070528 RepID=A0A6C0DZD7_9ZZZZ
MILPIEPGLERRRAYGHYINQRNMQRRNRRRNATYMFSISGLSITELHASTTELHPIPSDTNNGLTYEALVELPAVMIGLSISDLYESSSINVCMKSSFCSICQDDTHKEVDILRKLDCGHEFHIQCIDRWFIDHYQCPLCKKSYLKRVV